MPRKNRLTLWQKLARFTPMTVRLLARKSSPTGRPVAMSDDEISLASGLALARVKGISWSESWDGIPVSDMRDFMLACGIDIGDRDCVRQIGSYLSRGCAFTYLRRHPDWRSTFEPLMKQWLATN